MLRADQTIGPYTLITKLGRGAFGVVWLAERRTTIATTKVALKMPLDDEVELSAVRQEADLWVKASGHPNVLPIIEANIYDGQIIIASEYAPDGSLETWLNEHDGAAPSTDAAVEMTLGILAGLDHLHSRQIIHRDLKPANLLLQGETPRLADFGISRILKSTSQSNIVAGTPLYMAPEAFDGKRNEQTDIWSVGVIFYQMVSGNLPFPQGDITSLMGAILTRNPDPLPVFVPKPFQAVIEQALAKDVRQRYKTASEMKIDLRKAIGKLQQRDYINEISLSSPSKDQTSTKLAGAIPNPSIQSAISVGSGGAAAKPISTTSPSDTRTPHTSSSQAKVQTILPRSAYIVFTLLALSIVFGGIVLLFKSGVTTGASPSDTTTQRTTQPTQTILTRGEIDQMMESWRQSWERGDLSLYSTYYDVNFSGRNYSPQKGYRFMNRNEWIKDKEQKLRQSQIGSIQLGPKTINYEGNDAIVSFTQSYRSTTYSDSGRKTLYLRKLASGEIKIFKEDFTPELR